MKEDDELKYYRERFLNEHRELSIALAKLSFQKANSVDAKLRLLRRFKRLFKKG